MSCRKCFWVWTFWMLCFFFFNLICSIYICWLWPLISDNGVWFYCHFGNYCEKYDNFTTTGRSRVDWKLKNVTTCCLSEKMWKCLNTKTKTNSEQSYKAEFSESRKGGGGFFILLRFVMILNIIIICKKKYCTKGAKGCYLFCWFLTSISQVSTIFH